MIMEHFGLTKDSKTLAKNGYKEEVITEEELAMEQLNVEEQRIYRASAAHLNYISQDNPCIQFSSKEAFRSMSCPTLRDFQRIKKIVRFSVGVKTVRFNFQWQSEDEANQMQLFVDSDWAGCAVTRRSTSGGLLKLGMHTLKT